MGETFINKWHIPDYIFSKNGPFSAANMDKSSNEVISLGVNRVVSNQCSLNHAEVLALTVAQTRLDHFSLRDPDDDTKRPYTLFSRWRQIDER